MTSSNKLERQGSKIIDAQLSFSNDELSAETFGGEESLEKKLIGRISGQWKLSNDSLERCSKDGVTTSAIYSKIISFTRNQHDKRWFCLECGTQDDKFQIFLMIRNSSDGDEWEQELCKMTHKRCTCIKRVVSYNPCSQSSREVGRIRAQSDYNTSGGFTPNDSSTHGECFVFGEKKQDDTHNNNSIEEGKLSLPGSLHSYLTCSSDSCSLNTIDAPIDFENKLSKLREERDEESVTKKFMKTDLEKELELAEFKGKVYVVRWEHPKANSNLHEIMPLFTGDCIRQISNQRVDDVEGARYFIHTTASEEVSLILERDPCGLVVPIRVSSFEDLGIELKGSEIQKMDSKKLLRETCDPLRVCSGEERSKRSITAIGVFGEKRVPFDATTDKVKQMLIDAIRDARDMGEPLVLHLHPTAFLMALKQPKPMVPINHNDLVNMNLRKGASPRRRGNELDE